MDIDLLYMNIKEYCAQVGISKTKQASKKGTSSPFYNVSGLPGSCQVTVGAECRQNANIPHFGSIKKEKLERGDGKAGLGSS